MNEREFLDMVARLEDEGTISAEEAEALREAYALGEVTAADLPLSPREGSTSLPGALMLAALIDALLRAALVSGSDERTLALLGARMRLTVAAQEATGALLEEWLQDGAQRLLEGRAGGGGLLPPRGGGALGQAADDARRRTGRILDGLPQRRRDRLARDFVGIFGDEADRRTARLLFSDRYTDGMRRWQVAAREMMRDDLMALAAMGQRRPLSADDLNRLGRVWRRQQAHLQRFAEEIAAREALGRPMTEKQIAARLRQYAGAGYSEYWRGMVQQYVGRFGYVVVYNSVDDGGTCSRCREAEDGGPYLPGTSHPLPGGDTCLGRGHCRCWLRIVFDMAAYERLTQQREVAA